MSLTTDMNAILAQELAMGGAETITYRPYGGTPRAITAMVNRSEPGSEFVGGSEASSLRYVVTVSDDPVLGIDHPHEGRDLMEIAVRRPHPESNVFRLTRILSQDPGAYTLEVVK